MQKYKQKFFNWLLFNCLYLLTRMSKFNKINKFFIARGSLLWECQLVVYNNIDIFVALNGGLAQMARAFDPQSKGHRFESDILHF
jgi:hypothetical protein